MNSNQEHKILSICIPTYNRAKELSECLESIFSQEYSRENIEVLISDNSSSDSTFDTVTSFLEKGNTISYYKNESNIGPENNFRLSMLRANGKYVWLIGDDDKLSENSISEVIKLIQTNCALLIVNFAIYSKDFSRVLQKNYLPAKKINFKDHNDVMKIFGGNIGLISCHVVMRELVLSVNDAEYKKYNDYGFSFLYSIYIGILNNSPILYLEKPALLNRAENSVIPNWPKFFITGIAMVIEDLVLKGYQKSAGIKAMNKHIIKTIIPYLIFRKKTTGNVLDVNSRVRESYRNCWSYRLLYLPISLLPNIPFQLIRKTVRWIVPRKT